MKKRSYAIIGTGAIGGFYGALLQKAGHEVHFYSTEIMMQFVNGV